MAPPLYDVDIGDITYEAPTKLPMESEGIRSIGLESEVVMLVLKL